MTLRDEPVLFCCMASRKLNPLDLGLFEGLFYNLTLLKRTTGGNEGYHAGTKNCMHGHKPSDDIGKSYQKINHLQATVEMNQFKKCSQHDASQYGKMDDTEVRPVKLSEYVNDCLSSQNKDSKNYVVFCYEVGKYYVKRHYNLDVAIPYEDLGGGEYEEHF